MTLDRWTDADWADDKLTRRSRSSGHVEADGIRMLGFSSRQTVWAQSTCESEWYAAAKGLSETCGSRSLFSWLGYEVYINW